MADDLESFLQWAKERGHYAVAQLAENFRLYMKEVQQAKVDAIEKRVKSDE